MYAYLKVDGHVKKAERFCSLFQLHFLFLYLHICKKTNENKCLSKYSIYEDLFNYCHG